MRLNKYTATALQLFVVLITYTLLRILFYAYNSNFVGVDSLGEFMRVMLNGVRFDISAICYLNLLFILMRLLPFRFADRPSYITTTNWVYYISNSIGFIANIADTSYFRFTNYRTQFNFFEEFFSDSGAASIIIGYLPEYWYLVVVFIISMAIIVLFTLKIKITECRYGRISHYISRCLIMIFGILLTVIGLRGSFLGTPLRISDALLYVDNSKSIATVLNTPFSIIRSIGDKNTVKQLRYFDDESELLTVFNPIHTPPHDSTMIRKNVVMIILEGIGAQYLDSFSDRHGDTIQLSFMPLLDSIAKQSHICLNTYSVGIRSVEGVTSLLCEFPSFRPNMFIKSLYFDNKIEALAGNLKHEGYETSLYHGCNEGSYGFERLAHQVGYSNFYGRNEYGNDDDYDGTWGIFDDKMGNFVADHLSKSEQPFFATWYLLSSHSPYVLPKEFQNRYSSPGGSHNESVEYTNEVLEILWSKISKTNWYKNTIFVITSDHTTYVDDPKYSNPNDRYRVPLIFFTPDGSLSPGVDSLPTSQIDIGPSILGFLNYNMPYYSMGRDVFSSNSERMAVSKTEDIYKIFYGDWILFFDGEKSLHLYNKREDPLIVNDVIDKYPDEAAFMEKKLKAILQTYTVGLTENKLHLL